MARITGTSSSAVMKVSLDGGTPVTLASGLSAPGHIAVDASSVYFTTSGAVMKMPLQGGTPTTLAFIDESETDGLAVNATGVYRIQIGGVWKVPLGGGTSTMIASRRDGHGAIAVLGTSVYWLDNPLQIID